MRLDNDELRPQYITVVMDLLRHGADTSVVGMLRGARSARYAAFMLGSARLARYLLDDGAAAGEAADVDAVDTSGWTSLLVACASTLWDTSEVIRELVWRGVDIHRPPSGRPALANARVLDNVRVLLEHGARPRPNLELPDADPTTERYKCVELQLRADEVRAEYLERERARIAAVREPVEASGLLPDRDALGVVLGYVSFESK